MNMVYIVTAGEYEGYHIERVFQSMEKAKRYAEVIENKLSPFSPVFIEPYNLSDDEIEDIIAEWK